MFEDLFSEAGFSLDRCRSFLDVAKAGGITQAASGSASRQSQLSRQIAELETWIGGKLLLRGRRFALTPQGIEFRAILLSKFSELERLRGSIKGATPIVRIGAGESLLQWIVSPAVPLMGSHRWHLQNLRSEEIISGLLDGVLDFGLLRNREAPKLVRLQNVLSLEYRFFVPKALMRHTMQVKGVIPVAQLEEGNHVDQFGSPQSVTDTPCDVRIWCTSLAQVAELVRRGKAAAILPSCAVSTMPSTVEAQPLKAPAKSITLWLAWDQRREKAQSDFDNTRILLAQSLRVIGER